MTIEVFWGSGSPFAWRVLLMLEAKRIAYASRLLSFSEREHKAPEFLALNPRGQVPAIRDGELALHESLAIMAYLERRFPEPPLYGRTAAETGRVWQAIMEQKSHVEPRLDRIIGPLFRGTAAEKAADMQAAAGELHQELAALEATAARQGWLALAELTAADLAFYPFLELVLRVANRDTAKPYALGLDGFARRYPALEAWRGRIRALDGYERTYPPHWREAA